MLNQEKTAFIIGNGASRKSFDLLQLKNKGTVFGCNALYRDFVDKSYILPDYLVAIDNPIITEIECSDFPSKRFINPPEKEKWEPVELHWGNSISKDWDPKRPRSNAGMNAIIESIKMGFTDLFILGFDQLVVNQSVALSNLYDGTKCYGMDTRANLQDTRNRMKYLGWLIENNSKIIFTFCYPQVIMDSGVYNPQAKNCKLISFERLKENLNG